MKLAITLVAALLSFDATIAAPVLFPEKWVNTVLPEGASKPSAIGLHKCSKDFYSPAALNAGLEGTTSLRYSIAEDGTVKDVTVFKSSGSEVLDKASVTCVGYWRYKPAALAGKPIAVAWRNDVKWVLPEAYRRHSGPDIVIQMEPPSGPPPKIVIIQPPEIGPVAIGKPHDCRPYLPDDAVAENATGTVKLNYLVDTSGRTKDIEIAESSDFAVLDDVSVACVSRWRYKPATTKGKPAEAAMEVEIRWPVR